MSLLKTSPLLRLRWRWALALAFLLPLAQAAGWVHELSHTSSQAAGSHAPKGLSHADACGLCLLASALGGAVPAAAAVVVAALGAAVAPRMAAAAAPPLRVLRWLPARGPPLSLP